MKTDLIKADVISSIEQCWYAIEFKFLRGEVKGLYTNTGKCGFLYADVVKLPFPFLLSVYQSKNSAREL